MVPRRSEDEDGERIVPPVESSTLHIKPGDGAPLGEPPQQGARRRELTTEECVAGILAGERTAIAQSITLIESNAPAHFARAQELIQALLPHAGRAIRVGITGVPGAGKSTLIESLGTHLTAQGHRVAVTAVDPSSSISGGSILGDKTRMAKLAADSHAFIRPAPSGGTLGGVGRKTRETILVFEAAGYDVILIETVGVGQSEILVRSMVDFFLLVLIAGGGDELQGIKKGVMELADAIAINKADGPNRTAAEAARAEYERALQYLRPATEGWTTRAVTLSAQTSTGVAEIWRVIEEFHRLTTASGALTRRRRDQELAWLHALVGEHLQELFRTHPRIRTLLPELEQAVRAGRMPATAAARALIEAFGG